MSDIAPRHLEHPELVKLLQLAYSAERAAAFAYIGHAQSLRDPDQRAIVSQIEADEWDHRAEVLAIMERYRIPVSRVHEIRFWVVGRLISASCRVIGRFMAYYFAGRLESGNVCEYFRMMHFFEEAGITDHHDELYAMGLKEKEHEILFLTQIREHGWMSRFEKVLYWGRGRSYNDVDLAVTEASPLTSEYCLGTRLSRVRLLDRGSN